MVNKLENFSCLGEFFLFSLINKIHHDKIKQQVINRRSERTTELRKEGIKRIDEIVAVLL